MIALTRNTARQFWAVMKKCISTRARPPDPAVLLQVAGGVLTLFVETNGVAVVHTTKTIGLDESLRVPTSVLDAIAGTTDDPVELSVGPKFRGLASCPRPRTWRRDPGRRSRDDEPHSDNPEPRKESADEAE